jgi:hypothetical protein
VLDGLAVDPLLEADVADVHARDCVRGILLQHAIEREQCIVVRPAQHLRPSQQHQGLRVIRHQFERATEFRFGRGWITARDEAPAAIDVCRRIEAVTAGWRRWLDR